MKRITIRDVAKEAGVSITTVSHALSGQGVLKQETRDRVIAIARKMQYIPDWSGQNLKSVETGMLGFFTYSIAGLYGVLVDAMYQECKILRDKSTVWLALGTTGGKSIWRCPVCCLFFSGKYDDLIQPKVGFYTQVSGLGKMSGKSGCIISVW